MAEWRELVILGGGLAGLSLAARLADMPQLGRLCVIEPRRGYTDDRSFSFWAEDRSTWSSRAYHRWDEWQFACLGGESLTRRAAGWRYVYLRSKDVYDEALGRLSASPHIELRLGSRVEQVLTAHGGFEVRTDSGSLRARHVVDTRPPPASRLLRSQMFQCFVGRELLLHDARLDPQKLELMTDMRSDAHGFVFSYVLPFSTDRVLVEATRFSSRPLDFDLLAADLDRLVARRGWQRATALRTEQAVLPMGLPPIADDERVPGVCYAGTTAGALRAASGYGFLRIQSWADQCAEALRQGFGPLGHTREPALQRWMDRLFLKVLAAYPERAPELFLRLARTVPGPSFVRFMSDKATPLDLFHVIGALPPGPFLSALRGGIRIKEHAA
jgi:lycopene beta-cyclase